MGGKVPATSNATRARPEPEPAARRRPWPAALAWSLYALVLLLFAAFPVLDRLARHAGRPDLALLAPFVVAPSLAAFTASTVGAVLASRRPRHPVGWLLLTPTGSAPSARWRRWGVAAAMAVLAVAATVAPGSLDARALAVEGPVGPRAFGGALAVLNQLALAMAILIILGGAASLVTRFRRAHGVERQQLRWVALAAALTGAAMLATAVLVAVGDLALAGWASVLGTVFLPLATGAAILRYRLYDLDQIISRTVAYGLLTVLLGLGYAAVVLGLGRLLPERSSLAVAAATLAVVDQTMQPTQAWLWQRPPPERAGR
jgi:hypothetical protein